MSIKINHPTAFLLNSFHTSNRLNKIIVAVTNGNGRNLNNIFIVSSP